MKTTSVFRIGNEVMDISLDVDGLQSPAMPPSSIFLPLC